MTDSHIDTVYTEGSSWIRLANIIVWSMAAVILPIAISSIGLAAMYPQHRPFLAFGSIYLFGVWIYLSIYYGSTATNTRKVLMRIEEEWKLSPDEGYIRAQGLPGMRVYGLNTVLCLMFFVFLGAWIYVLTV